MPFRSRLLFIGGLTLVVGLLVLFPARIAYQWFVPTDVRLSSIEGSVWYGSAAEASIAGVYLRDLRWRFRPAALFTGGIGYAIEARPSSGFVEGNIKVGITGTLTASDLNASFPLHLLQAAMRTPGLAGSMSVQIQNLKLDGSIPVAADGFLEVANLIIPAVHRYPIGGYRAEFFTQDSGVMSSVEDVSGMLDLAGTLQISTNGTYEFLAQLAAKENTPDNVRRQMQFLGSPNERGQRELRLEGQL